MAEFTTRLQNRVELDGSWECGLSEILFSKNWYNLRKNNHIMITFVDSFRGSVSENTLIENLPFNNIPYTVRVRDGTYKSATDLINEIAHRTSRIISLHEAPLFRQEIERGLTSKGGRNKSQYWPRFQYNESTGRTEIVSPRGVMIRFTDELRQALGFNQSYVGLPINRPDTGEHESVRIVSDNRIDLSDKLQCFYAYCDILESIPVGHTRSPLLRIINSGDEEVGSLVKRHYNFPYYVPVQKNNFDTLEIKLLTDTGHAVPFQDSGKVVLTLHFRIVENY